MTKSQARHYALRLAHGALLDAEGNYDFEAILSQLISYRTDQGELLRKDAAKVHEMFQDIIDQIRVRLQNSEDAQYRAGKLTPQ